MERFLEVRIRAVRDDLAGAVECAKVAHEVGRTGHGDHRHEDGRRKQPCHELCELRHVIVK